MNIEKAYNSLVEILENRTSVVAYTECFEYNKSGKYLLTYTPFRNASSDFIGDVRLTDKFDMGVDNGTTWQYDEADNSITIEGHCKYKPRWCRATYKIIVLPKQEILHLLDTIK